MKPFSPHKFANDAFVLVPKSVGLSPPNTKFEHSTGTFSLNIHTLFEIQTFQALLTCLIHHNTTTESDEQNVLQMLFQISKSPLLRKPILIVINKVIPYLGKKVGVK